MYQYKLTEITLNDGTTVIPRKLTVIVGPNNSGKSRALKEVSTFATNANTMSGVVVNNVKWTMPNNIEDLRESYDVERYQNRAGSWEYRVLNPELIDETHNSSRIEWPAGYQAGLYNDAAGPNLKYFAESFGKAMIGFLTTEQRLQLVKETASPGHEKQTSNVLHALYNAGRATEQEIRQLTKSAFGQEIALDFSTLQNMLLRVGLDFSGLPIDPREARSILSGHERLDEQGDGLRSFVGIVVTLLSVKRGVFLIDEPEAFLHPPQAFRIGEFLSDQADNSLQIVLATHSADVLRGIISKTQDVTIIRIDRSGAVNRFNILDPERLKELITDPLLSSARVLDGLFYSGALVVEGPSDSRFYLAVSKKRQPDSDLHFVNADNKQTVPKIMSLYRDMGVRCAGIVDFDVLNDYVEFQTHLNALGLEKTETANALAIQKEIAGAAKEPLPEERLETAKQQLSVLLAVVADIQNRTFTSEVQSASEKEKALQHIGRGCYQVGDSAKVWKELKQNGRAVLPPPVQMRFDELWKICLTKGFVINPCGELESLLVEYGIQQTTDKRAWIVQALQLIPSLEVDDEKYPWKLMKSIHQLLVG